MIIIGVTGGIGAGKSSVSGILEELGARVIDADLISKRVVEPGQPALERITEEFGGDVLLPDGSLNRSMMADIVFGCVEKRMILEKIIHCEVANKMRNMLDSFKNEGYDGIVVLDVPIPVENGFLDTVDKVWVVYCNDEERIRRIMSRSGLSYDEALNRIKAQKSQEEYLLLADEAIPNEGSIGELKQRVSGLVDALRIL